MLHQIKGILGLVVIIIIIGLSVTVGVLGGWSIHGVWNDLSHPSRFLAHFHRHAPVEVADDDGESKPAGPIKKTEAKVSQAGHEAHDVVVDVRKATTREIGNAEHATTRATTQAVVKADIMWGHHKEHEAQVATMPHPYLTAKELAENGHPIKAVETAGDALLERLKHPLHPRHVPATQPSTPSTVPSAE